MVSNTWDFIRDIFIITFLVFVGLVAFMYYLQYRDYCKQNDIKLRDYIFLQYINLYLLSLGKFTKD